MLSGVTLYRKSIYSSVWNCVISYLEAGFARWSLSVWSSRETAPRLVYNEAGHRIWTHIYLHFGIKTVVHNKTMRHSYSVRLHRMPSNISIIANIRIVEIGHFLGIRGAVEDGAAGVSAGNRGRI
jgi:hypothetical protein